MISAVPDERSGVDLWEDRIVCRSLRRALGIVLFGLLVWGLLPFLAPVAYHWGYPLVGRAIHLLYTPFCHQLPQRSWFLFGPQLTYTVAEIADVAGTENAVQLRFFLGSPELGWKMAWSDRMVSFYFMRPVFGLLYAGLRRLGVSIRPLSTRLLLLLVLPMFFDGLTHMMNDTIWGISADGFRDTNSWLALLTANRFPGLYAGDHLGTFNWWMRLLSGLLAAYGLAFYLFPRLDNLLRSERVGGSERSMKDRAAWCCQQRAMPSGSVSTVLKSSSQPREMQKRWRKRLQAVASRGARRPCVNGQPSRNGGRI